MRTKITTTKTYTSNAGDFDCHANADWFSSCVERYVPKPVQILLLHRFFQVPTYKVQPAGANLQIQPFILRRTRVRITHTTTLVTPPTITLILI
jgi:hypothetical protein